MVRDLWRRDQERGPPPGRSECWPRLVRSSSANSLSPRTLTKKAETILDEVLPPPPERFGRIRFEWYWRRGRDRHGRRFRSALGRGEFRRLFVDLAGCTMLERAVDAVLASGVVDRVLVAVPSEMVGTATELLGGRADVISGGPERPETVLKALSALPVGRELQPGEPHPANFNPANPHPASPRNEPQYVLVHDAARPLTPPAVIRRVIDAPRAGSRAVIPVLPVSDTIKAVDASGTVLSTRSAAACGPFKHLRDSRPHCCARCTSGPPIAVTDDASLVERAGIPVRTVPGDPMAFKITTPLDLRLARAVLET